MAPIYGSDVMSKGDADATGLASGLEKQDGLSKGGAEISGQAAGDYRQDDSDPKVRSRPTGLTVDVSVTRGGFGVQTAFRAEPGQTVALLGPNGAGKSTLLAAVAGLVAPSTGTITLDGRILDDVARGVHVAAPQRGMGLVFQDLLLFPHLTALQNVAFPLEVRGQSRADAIRQAAVMLETVGVTDRATALPAQLSGGEAQRVALARALVSGPRLLLLDEPLAALDVQAKGQIRALLRTIRTRFDGSILLVTHDPVDAMTLADHILLLEAGRITQAGTPADLRGRPQTAYAAALVGLNIFVGRLEPLDRGAGRLVTADGDLVVGWPVGLADLPLATTVTAVLRPADVVLHLTRPEGSARNVLAGPIAGISIEGERARVHVASHPAVTAEVTLGSVERLGLVEELPVWAAFKAVELQVEA